jgi:hypothetical protein
MKKDLDKTLEPWIKKYNCRHKKSMAQGQRITFLLEFYNFLPYKGLMNSTIFRGIILTEMDTEAMNVLDGIHAFYKKQEKC